MNMLIYIKIKLQNYGQMSINQKMMKVAVKLTLIKVILQHICIKNEKQFILTNLKHTSVNHQQILIWIYY